MNSIIEPAGTSMRAAVIVNPRKCELREFPLPRPGKDQARIRLEGSGVCASNIPVWEGREWFRYPLPPGEPGHEGWGTVEELGEGEHGFRRGDRVCCLTYHAYSTHDLAPIGQMVRLPAKLDGYSFPGEPLGCAMNILDRSDCRAGHTVAVVGAGFLGSLLIQLCKSEGARVIAVSRRAFSLETAERCGADEIVPMDEQGKVLERVSRITRGRFCDRVIEATGKEWPLNLSIEMTAVRGKVIVAGFHQDGIRQVNMQLLNWRGIDLVSAHERDPGRYVNGMRRAVEAVLGGRMDPRPLLTHVFGLDELGKALDLVTGRADRFVKATVRP